uniref:Protein alan shepard n=1 Tax=Sarcoptes scabiei TaxID=52283 RepID=A0A834R236_SARSC
MTINQSSNSNNNNTNNVSNANVVVANETNNISKNGLPLNLASSASSTSSPSSSSVAAAVAAVSTGPNNSNCIVTNLSNISTTTMSLNSPSSSSLTTSSNVIIGNNSDGNNSTPIKSINGNDSFGSGNTPVNNNIHNNFGNISKTNLYIRGLTPDTTDKDLQLLCQPYGRIVSTKAILDKETNQCRGYGFVDFDSPIAAEQAVKSLISQGVQAQMAKCADVNRGKNIQKVFQTQEHDPTNLYIANLPMNMAEVDLEKMLSLYGYVVSTRILKDVNGTPRGVGFARMESKEKCENVINILNGKFIPGCKDALLVKFADGGVKKKIHHKNDNRYRNEIDPLQMTFESTNITPNGVASMLSSSMNAPTSFQRFSTPYHHQNPMQPNPWMHQPPQPQYIMQMIASQMDPNAQSLAYSPLMQQLTAQMSHLQMGVSGASYMPGNPHPYGTQMFAPHMMPTTMPMSGLASATASDVQDQINLSSKSNTSGSITGEDPQQQQQQQQNQQTAAQTQPNSLACPPQPQQHNFPMCYNQK